MNSVGIYNNPIIKKIEKRLQQPLPGSNAHQKMQPYNTEKSIPSKTSSFPAAVLILLYPDKNNNLWTVYIRRTNDYKAHGGQISFPGGKKDPNDYDIIATALRETEEELGIDKKQIKIIGQLTPLLIRISNHKVFPLIGLINKKPDFKPNIDEVAYLIKVPLSQLMEEHASISFTSIKYQQTNLKVPHYNLDGEILWGATAMITSELIELFH